MRHVCWIQCLAEHANTYDRCSRRNCIGVQPHGIDKRLFICILAEIHHLSMHVESYTVLDEKRRNETHSVCARRACCDHVQERPCWIVPIAPTTKLGFWIGAKGRNETHSVCARRACCDHVQERPCWIVPIAPTTKLGFWICAKGRNETHSVCARRALFSEQQAPSFGRVSLLFVFPTESAIIDNLTSGRYTINEDCENWWYHVPASELTSGRYTINEDCENWWYHVPASELRRAHSSICASVQNVAPSFRLWVFLLVVIQL